jgi:uncharacterized protein (TIGR02246 family)
MNSLVRTVATLVLLIISVISAVAADELGAQVEAANAAWTSAFNAKNVENMTSLYADDAILLPAGRSPVKGKDALSKHWREVFERLGNSQAAFETIEARREGSIVYVVGRYEISVPKAEGATEKFGGNNVRIFDAPDRGEWRMRVHIYNAVE